MEDPNSIPRIMEADDLEEPHPTLIEYTKPLTDLNRGFSQANRSMPSCSQNSKGRRNVYSDIEIDTILGVVNKLMSERKLSRLAAVRHINKIPNYSRLCTRMVHRWQQKVESGVIMKRGPKTCLEFEQDLISEITSIDNGSCGVNYDKVRSAIVNVLQRDSRWGIHPLVSKLKFSDQWIHCLLKKYKLGPT